MPHRDAPAICRKIDAALDVIGENEDEMRPYLLYQIEQMMGGPEHITMDDCTTSELMSLAALLAPVFSRCLPGAIPFAPDVKSGIKRLTLIYDGTTGTN